MIDAIGNISGNISSKLFGLDVRTSTLVEPVPKIQLSCDFNCSDKVREDMNAWLLDMFGTKEVAYMFNNTLVLSHETLRKLKQDLAQKGLA